MQLVVCWQLLFEKLVQVVVCRQLLGEKPDQLVVCRQLLFEKLDKPVICSWILGKKPMQLVVCRQLLSILRRRTTIYCLLSCLRTTSTCTLFDMCYSRSICATSDCHTKRKHLLFLFTSSTWLHIFYCFRECVVTVYAADTPAPPPSPGTLGGSLLVADMLAVASSCADNCRAGVCCVQTARRVAT